MRMSLRSLPSRRCRLRFRFASRADLLLCRDQERGVVTQDGCASSLGQSAYKDFYPDCYLPQRTTEPFNTSTTPADLVQHYQYDSDRYNGYAVFLGVAEGRDNNIQRAFDLKANLWTDKATRLVTIKFAFYNGNIGCESHVSCARIVSCTILAWFCQIVQSFHSLQR
jgi:hypothetical protein